MLTTLLLVIFISFIGVGLPDSVLGSAWPSIYREFNLPISLQGYISIIVSIGTVVSSLMSARLIRRFGTGGVTAGCTLLTAIALFGFAFAPAPVFFFLFALPLGLGAGSIDTALNSFVALHYNASKMNFLHCFYGLGVAASPFVISLALGANGDWRRGYFIVAILQSAITLVTFLALPLWKKVQKQDAEADLQPTELPLRGFLKNPVLWYSCLAFFFSCAFELTAGIWSSSFFVNTKGLPADKAALTTMVYYLGLACGRLLSGLSANKLGRRRILRISIGILFFDVALFALPFETWLSVIALFLLGVGIGPVYPNLAHLTPKFFGKERSQAIMGIQQASTYIGIMLMPWLFGVLAQAFSTALLPYYLLTMLTLYALCFFLLLRAAKKAKKRTPTI